MIHFITKTFSSAILSFIFLLLMTSSVSAGEIPEECRELARQRKQDFIRSLEGKSKEEKQRLMQEAQPAMYAEFENCLKGYTKELTEEQQTRMQERKNTAIEQTEERRTAACERITESVSKRIATYNENQRSHNERYNTLLTRLRAISARMEALGLDVSELDFVIDEFESMVVDYQSSYAEFIAQLEEAEPYACGESDGAFRDALTDAQEYRLHVIDQRRAIFDFYKTDVRSAIKNLREQARQLGAGDSAGEVQE